MAWKDETEMTVNVPASEENLGRELFAFQKRGHYIDVTLKTQDGDQIPCHKCVLASQSEFFDRLFSGGMKESQEDTILLPDVCMDVLKIIVEFLYTSKCTIPYASFLDVLVAADMLVLDNLRYLLIEGFVRRCEQRAYVVAGELRTVSSRESEGAKEHGHFALLIFEVWRLHMEHEHLFRVSPEYVSKRRKELQAHQFRGSSNGSSTSSLIEKFQSSLVKALLMFFESKPGLSVASYLY